MAESAPGTRPEEWWTYEKRMSPPDNEATKLYAMGELTEPELDALMAEWRAQYERAQHPAFTLCLGYRPGQTVATWVKGAAARRAHYRGIPRGLLRRWNAERRRRAARRPVLVK
jgi:hypothetical protein